MCPAIAGIEPRWRSACLGTENTLVRICRFRTYCGAPVQMGSCGWHQRQRARDRERCVERSAAGAAVEGVEAEVARHQLLRSSPYE